MEANAFVQTQLRPICPVAAVLSTALPDKCVLRPDLALSNYGMKQGSTHVSMEKHGLWTARLGLLGTRTVAIFNSGDVKAYLKHEGLVGKDSGFELWSSTTALSVSSPCASCFRHTVLALWPWGVDSAALWLKL